MDAGLALLALDRGRPCEPGFGQHVRCRIVGVIRHRRTVDRCRAAGTAWVQADQIEPLQHRLRNPRQKERHVLQTRLTRATRVEDHRADPIRLLFVPRPNDLQRDLVALGMGIVERNRELPTPRSTLGARSGANWASCESRAAGQSPNAIEARSRSARRSTCRQPDRDDHREHNAPQGDGRHLILATWRSQTHPSNSVNVRPRPSGEWIRRRRDRRHCPFAKSEIRRYGVRLDNIG